MKGITLLSGGMDSTTLLYYLLDKEYEVKALIFDYGQRHKKEIEYAINTCNELNIEYKIVNLDFMKEIGNSSALLSNKSMPHEHYTNENQKVTVVPNRNMIMLSIAIAWAENEGYDAVFYAPHSNDYSIYPDCRPEFVESIDKTSQLGTYNNIKVIAPFVKISKADIVRIGYELGVDFTKTWSCYEGGDKHCGVCATCQERKEAFKLAGIEDPTEYER